MAKPQEHKRETSALRDRTSKVQRPRCSGVTASLDEVTVPQEIVVLRRRAHERPLRGVLVRDPGAS